MPELVLVSKLILLFIMQLKILLGCKMAGKMFHDKLWEAHLLNLVSKSLIVKAEHQRIFYKKPNRRKKCLQGSLEKYGTRMTPSIRNN